MEIGDLCVLARLPRPAVAGDGDTQFCQVYGVRNGQRKKRHEICAAVNGNSLNIYEVINGRSLASWPVPPDANFVYEPISERISSMGRDFIRQSWAVLRRRGHNVMQKFEQKRTGIEVSSSTTSFDLNNNSKVVQLATTGKAGCEIIVIQENGQITTVRSGGLNPLHKAQMVNSSGAIKILAAQCFSLDAARSSLLKSRQDLVAYLTDDCSIIAAVYEKAAVRGLFYGVWTVALEPSGTKIAPIVSHDLGPFVQQVGKNCDVRFVAEGEFEVICSNTSTRLDMTTIVPQRLLSQRHVLPNAMSSLELNKDITMYALPGKLYVGNTRLDSVLATSVLSDSSRKRKRNSEAAAGLKLIAFFPQIKRVVASDGKQLLVIDLVAKDSIIDPFKQGSLLSGNVLRGSSAMLLHHQRKSSGGSTCIGKVRKELITHNWHIVSAELDALAARNDTKGFTDVFLKHFDLRSPDDLKSIKIPASNVDYLLAKLFKVTDKSTGQLSVSLGPHELLKWCMQAGILNEQRIARALRLDRSTFTTGSLAKALIDFDESLTVIESYIQISPFLDSASLVHIINTMVDQALRQSAQDMDTANVAETDAVKEGLSVRALVPGADPDDELNTSNPCTICLAHALKRLCCTGSVTVSASLRSLDQRIVLGLIQFLRQQLFLGRYSRLDNLGHPHSALTSIDEEFRADNPNPQLSFSSIITLLNGCIDAIGPVGVLGAGEDELFVQKMVPELLTEISSATEAIEDAALLQGLVRETVRYVQSMEQQPLEVRHKVENKVKSDSAVRCQVVTLYAEPDMAEGCTMPASALPLSLKAQEEIDRYKIRKGGQAHRRSAREIGMLRDRLRVPYSFERLIL